MPRDKNLPLTETVYYILLSLMEPGHGYRIMQSIEELSRAEVRMAAGTLYGAIENLLRLRFIRLAASDGRRKVYAITDLGKEILRADMSRMQHMIDVTREAFSKEDHT